MLTPLLTITVVCTASILILGIFVFRLERKLRKLTQGTANTNVLETLRTLEQKQEDISKHLLHIDARLNQSVRNVQTVRFNPFKGQGMGGNQSFASAFIDERGNGVILSSLYARDHTSLFAKPVTAYESEHELTEEERLVLERARSKQLER
jgi:hypothetical protein